LGGAACDALRMLEITRNLWRRKLRSILTISGILMGILALTTMGSLSEHFNTELDGGVTYFGSSIQVGADGGNGFGGGYLPLSMIDQVKKVDGVQAVTPNVNVSAKPGDISGGGFNGSDTITAVDLNASRSAFKSTLASGRLVDDSARLEVTMGSTFASEFNLKVGDSIDLPRRASDAKPTFVNHSFKVVGIMNPTLSIPDNFAYVSLHDAQMLLGDALPPALQGKIDPYQISEGLAVYGPPHASLDELDRIADRITATVPGVKATKPSVLVNAFKQFGATFTLITTAAALLALIIGGLSVVNTMLMAVTERVREIGLKKAVGAKTHHIIREFLAESTLIGAIGGVLGLGLGYALTRLLDAGNKSGGLFLVTPRLALLCIGFAIVLGAVAGLIPAFRAARMDPVNALRSVG
jgi:putative ABC transport system permease protein